MMESIIGYHVPTKREEKTYVVLMCHQKVNEIQMDESEGGIQ